MVKKPFKGDYLTFEVRVSYDKKTDSIHLTSKDKDIPTKNGFHLTLNGGKDAEYALRTLLERKGMIPEERYLPVKAFYGDSTLHHVWDKFPLGIHADDTEAVWDSSSSNNVLLIGPSGAGKSVIQRSILFHCIQNSDQWRVLGIDLKQVELTPYKKYSPTVIEIATNLADSVETLRQAQAEMMKRYKEMQELEITNFQDMPVPPKSLLVMVDELQMLLKPLDVIADEACTETKLKGEALYLLNRMAALGRAAGIHLVLSTQFLDVDVVNGELIQNCTTRIAAGRVYADQSKALLGNDEATRLYGAVKGRGYVQHHGRGADFQAYFAPQDYVDDPRY